MSRINVIENKIREMEGGEFQKLCNSILNKTNPKWNITAFGSQIGTNKTIKGTPDTYFQKENGKIVCVEYTTKQNNVFIKINEDVDKCLLLAKKYNLNNIIDEIIYYYSSTTITIEEISELNKKCNENGIKLQLKSLTEISFEIQKFPSIAKEFFGILLDTNQVFDIEDFVKEYNDEKKIVPINTIFQFRDKEKKEIIEKINIADFVILYGQAGVGKTRLAVEIVKEFEKDGYKTICIKNKGLPLYDDIQVFIESQNEKYIFFIDDINETNGLKSLINYIKDLKCETKVIATVRQYALKEVVKIVEEQYRSEKIQINTVTNEEVEEFLRQQFSIINFQYIEKIKKISNGNLRIAYMAGRIAVDTGRLDSIYNAEQIYTEYYSSYFDEIVKNGRGFIVVLFLLVFFDKINLQKAEDAQDLYKCFGVEMGEFNNIVEYYVYNEIVNKIYNKFLYIPDQCFKNYVVYYTLIKGRYIELSILLENFFVKNKKKIIEIFNILLNIFAGEEVFEYVKREIEKAFDKIKNTDMYYSFVEVFQEFLPIEALIISKKIIDETPEEKIDEIIEEDVNFYNIDDNLALKYLCTYNNIKDVIELMVIYANKSKNRCLVCAKWLEEIHGIDYRNIGNEIVIAKKYDGLDINKKVNSYLIYKRIIYALNFEFSNSRVDNNIISTISFKLNGNELVNEYRAIYWELALELMKKNVYENKLINFLIEYSRMIYNKEYDSNIIKEDEKYVIKVLETSKINDIVKANIYKSLTEAYDKHCIKYEFPEYIELLKKPIVKLYLLLIEKNYELTFDDREKETRKKVKKYIENIEAKEIKEFIDILKKIDDICKNYPNMENISYLQSIIIAELCQSEEKSDALLRLIVKNDFTLEVPLHNIIKKAQEIYKPIKLFEKINSNNYKQKAECINYFVFYVEEKDITKEMYSNIKNIVLEDIEKNNKQFRDLYMLKKLFKFDENLFIDITKAIINKSKENKEILFTYLFYIFTDRNITIDELYKLYSKNIDILKEAYFEVNKAHRNIDYGSKFLLEAINKDRSWINCFVSDIVQNIKFYLFEQDEEEKVKLLWKFDNYNEIFDEIYENGIYKLEVVDILFKDFNFVSFKAEEKEQMERCKKWLCNLAEKCETTEKWSRFFKLISNVNKDIKFAIIQKLVDMKISIDLFKIFPFESSHFSWTGSEVPLIEKRIMLYESILEILTSVDLLEHRKYINDLIANLKNYTDDVRDKEYCMGLFNKGFVDEN